MDSATANPAPPLIRMSEVTIGSLRDMSAIVAEGVTWSVAAGDYWVIGGLQGAGKSDFLMLTGGLMAPVAGNYWLFSEEMPIFEEARQAERLRLGLVFDGGQLFNHLTIRENIALPLRYHRNLTPAQAESDVAAMLTAMELEPWADTTPGAIGRIWQKRVGLARALMLKPEVLLLDSPLEGLDRRHSHWWLRCLDELSRGHPLLFGRPVTLVVTAADLRPWKGRARQFAILREQRLTVLGTWAQLEAANAELLHELLPADAGEPDLH